MSIFQMIGVCGFVLYIASFAALQFRILDGNGFRYVVLNILAAIFVLISLVEAFNLASVLIQVSWIVIGIVGLAWKHKASALAGASRSTQPDKGSPLTKRPSYN